MISTLSRVRVQQREEVDRMEEQRRIQAEEAARNQQFQHESAEGMEEEAADADSPNQPSVREERKVGRNEPCPCGSGKNTNSVMVRSSY